MHSDPKDTRAKVVALTPNTGSSNGSANSTDSPESLAARNRARLARLPAAVHAVQEKGKQLISRSLRNLFDNADDALFALADKATSNHDQNLFFESMREVRIRRRELEGAFASAIDGAFLALVQRDAKPESDPYASDAARQKLSLVEHEELEELVAIDTLINKANGVCGENLQHLSMRLDSLVPNKVYQKTNPLGPDVICNAFVAACRQLDAELKAKLVLFKLFDEHVIAALPGIYDALNQTLIENNVLPSLKLQPTGAARNPQPAAPTAGMAQGPIGTSAPRPDQTQAQAQVPQQMAGQADAVVASAGSELMFALTHLQGLSGAPAASPAGVVDTDLVKRLLQNLQQQFGSGKMAQGQPETINFVQLLFDFILDDRNLAEPMKALLARMQIPILKVALLDPGFFKRNGHPARRLLNEMATASLGWQAPADEAALARDSLYNKIDGLVQRLLRDFETDVAVFDDLLADFVFFVEKERRRASILEQRLIDAEDGKARAEAARREVDAAIRGIVAGRTLPQGVDKILEEAWSNVLFFIYHKEGRDSEEWQQALQTAADLVWSVSGETQGEGRQRLLGMIPHLVKRLGEGLERISFDPFELTKLLNQLEKVHLARLQPSREPAAAAPKTEHRNERANENEARLAQAPSATALKVAAVEPDALEAAAEQSATTGAVSAQIPNGEASTTAPTTEAELDADSLAITARLTQGSWFEMSDEKGRAFRCRLAAIIKPSGKYIFVNRSGMKVGEKSRAELAVALRSGRISLLDDTMLFDRALEAVIGSQRKNR